MLKHKFPLSKIIKTGNLSIYSFSKKFMDYLLPIAHAPKPEHPHQTPHSLEEHLIEVAQLASKNAACFNASDLRG